MADLLVQLNANWRVADDPPQWALQSRDGPKREKASGWAGRKFVRNRDHLLHCITEQCGNADQQAIEIIRSWPVGYVAWKLQELKARSGPETAPYSAITSLGAHDHRKQQDPLVATAICAARVMKTLEAA